MISVLKYVNYKMVSVQMMFGSTQIVHRNVAYHVAMVKYFPLISFFILAMKTYY